MTLFFPFDIFYYCHTCRRAVADGLQLQWLLEPDVDMAAIVDALVTALTTPGGEPV